MESRSDLEDKDDLLGNLEDKDDLLGMRGFEACERRNEAVLLDLCTSMLASSIKELRISASDPRRRLNAKRLVPLFIVLSHGVIAFESGYVMKHSRV